MSTTTHWVMLLTAMVGALVLVPGIPGRWQKPAAAVPLVTGLEWVHKSKQTTAAVGQTATAVCPANKVILGGGGWASLPSIPQREVALTTRAQAHEDVDRTVSNWSLSAFAVCASTPQGYEVVYGESYQHASEATKDATAKCPDGKQLVSAGAATTNVAPANVSLMIVFPSSNLDDAHATAVENVPTDVNWDFIVAQAICTF